MKVDEAFKQRVYELCKLNKISFTTLCKTCKLNQSRVFNKGRGLNTKTLKSLCEVLKITTKQFFYSSYFNNLEF